jgi:hypothetical protein
MVLGGHLPEPDEAVGAGVERERLPAGRQHQLAVLSLDRHPQLHEHVAVGLRLPDVEQRLVEPFPDGGAASAASLEQPAGVWRWWPSHLPRRRPWEETASNRALTLIEGGSH